MNKYNLVLDIDYNVFATEGYQNSHDVKLEFPNECVCEFVLRSEEITPFKYAGYLYPKELSKEEGYAVLLHDDNLYQFINNCYNSNVSGFIYSDDKIVWCS